MRLDFDGKVIEWRGPAPFVFVRMPEADSDVIADVAADVTYGWGAIPVAVRIGDTSFTTSLFPKDGRYLVPVKAVVQRAEGIRPGDTVRVELSIDVDPDPC